MWKEQENRGRAVCHMPDDRRRRSHHLRTFHIKYLLSITCEDRTQAGRKASKSCMYTVEN